MLTASDDRLKIWSGASGECVRTLEGHRGFVSSAVFSPNEQQVRTASLLKVRLRPWSAARFLAKLPLKTLKGVAVCNKVTDGAAMGEPLFMDVAASLQKTGFTGQVLNSWFDFSSKDLVPGMVHSIFANLRKPSPQNPFTVGINTDITHYWITNL